MAQGTLVQLKTQNNFVGDSSLLVRCTVSLINGNCPFVSQKKKSNTLGAYSTEGIARFQDVRLSIPRNPSSYGIHYGTLLSWRRRCQHWTGNLGRIGRECQKGTELKALMATPFYVNSSSFCTFLSLQWNSIRSGIRKKKSEKPDSAGMFSWAGNDNWWDIQFLTSGGNVGGDGPQSTLHSDSPSVGKSAKSGDAEWIYWDCHSAWIVLYRRSGIWSPICVDEEYPRDGRARCSCLIFSVTPRYWTGLDCTVQFKCVLASAPTLPAYPSPHSKPESVAKANEAAGCAPLDVIANVDFERRARCMPCSLPKSTKHVLVE